MNITFIIILVATIAISYHACYLLVSSTPIGNISSLIWFHSISFRM